MSAPLAGRTIVVAGASSGIGRATARLLSARGAAVVALARRVPSLDGMTTLSVDVTDSAATATALEALPRIDAVVYCVGANVPRRRLDELTPDVWATLLAANLTGAFNLVHASLARLRAAHGDVIIVSSVSARWPDASGPAYQAAKGGLTSFADAIAVEEHDHGIRVCAIEPGMVDTPLLDRRPEPPTTEARARTLAPDDVAETIAFVLSLPRRATIPRVVILPSALQALGRT